MMSIINYIYTLLQHGAEEIPIPHMVQFPTPPRLPPEFSFAVLVLVLDKGG